MSVSSPVDPENNPELAAQEVVLELIKAGYFAPSNSVNPEGAGQSLAEASIAAHKALRAYYKTLGIAD